MKEKEELKDWLSRQKKIHQVSNHDLHDYASQESFVRFLTIIYGDAYDEPTGIPCDVCDDDLPDCVQNKFINFFQEDLSNIRLKYEQDLLGHPEKRVKE